MTFEDRLMEPANGAIALGAVEGDCAEGSRNAELIQKYKAQLTKCGLETKAVLAPMP